MFKLRHVFNPVNVREEREFERANVAAKLERYLRTNPLERLANDAAYRRKVELTQQLLGPVRGPILDIGGNTAGEATILQQRGFRMVVGDINESALGISQKRVEKFALARPDYVALDAHHLPFRDEAFAAVTVLEALHHFVDYDRVLGEIRRVLQPGGRLVSIEPNAANPIRRASEIRDRLRGTIEKSFHADGLRRLCERAGFVEVRVEPYASGKSSWKLEEVPVYRRSLARLHGWLCDTYPARFGALSLLAMKPGEPPPAANAELAAIVRSPVNGQPLRFDAAQQLWIEEGGEGAFPHLDGIPVLIADDRRPLARR